MSVFFFALGLGIVYIGIKIAIFILPATMVFHKVKGLDGLMLSMSIGVLWALIIILLFLAFLAFRRSWKKIG